MNSTPDNHSTSAKRTWGRFYTPPEIVGMMLQLAADAIDLPTDRPGRSARANPPAILDPACGDGALLLAAFDRINAVSAAGRTGDDEEGSQRRLKIVQNQLFGADVDRPAVARLRADLLQRVGPAPADEPAAIQTIAANIRVGDALTGSDFRTHPPASIESRPAESSDPPPLNWAAAFPGVAADGGFDAVICNPPYLREKHAKPMFDRIADTPLGRRWREPRMDLWYYFLHRALDVLKPDGTLTFIVNSYWTASSGSRRLTERLRGETTLRDVILLGDRPVFAGVSGRHLIFSLRKNQTATRCRVRDLSETPSIENIAVDERDSEATYSLDQAELYCEQSIRFDRPDRKSRHLHSCTLLGDVYEVRQGIAENPPRLSRRHCEILGGAFTVGQGVFVLSAAEVKRLGFTPAERELLRPYYRPADLTDDKVPPKTDLWLLYLTKKTAPELLPLPNIRRHLRRFRPILERRRETRMGKIPWWHLHWPREERLFTEPRLLGVQMAQRPQFVWARHATFVGFSVNVIARTTDSPLALPVLRGLLNSTAARRWFERRAKKRGVNLEIGGGLLRKFPLPARNAAIEEELSRLVERRSELGSYVNSPDDPSIAVIENEIDRCVESLYEAAISHPASIATE